MDKDETANRVEGGAKAVDGSTPAERALAEAAERRRQAENAAPPAREIGRAGPDPARYGDWEKRGITSDF